MLNSHSNNNHILLVILPGSNCVAKMLCPQSAKLQNLGRIKRNLQHRHLWDIQQWDIPCYVFLICPHLATWSVVWNSLDDYIYGKPEFHGIKQNLHKSQLWDIQTGVTPFWPVWEPCSSVPLRTAYIIWGQLQYVSNREAPQFGD